MGFEGMDSIEILSPFLHMGWDWVSINRKIHNKVTPIKFVLQTGMDNPIDYP